jgi:hypothetical protein
MLRPEREEVGQLRREVVKLKAVRDIPKQALGVRRRVLPLSLLCLQISRLHQRGDAVLDPPLQKLDTPAKMLGSAYPTM